MNFSKKIPIIRKIHKGAEAVGLGALFFITKMYNKKKSHPVYGNAILMLKFTNEENMKRAD